MDVLTKTLLQGKSSVHAFRSGGGLRVLRLEAGPKRGPLLAYSEAPQFDEALVHLSEDIENDGLAAKNYQAVYGINGKKQGYYTGTSSASSKADEMILCGGTLDLYGSDGVITAVFQTYERALKEEDWKPVFHGETVRIEKRGFTYILRPTRMPGGQGGGTCETIRGPGSEGKDDHMYEVTYTGKGATVAEAIEAALVAEPVEV